MKHNLMVARFVVRISGIPLIAALLVVAVMSGCDDIKKVIPPPPPPTIKVEQSETNQNSALVVTYCDHKQESLGNREYSDPFVRLENIEQLRAYKKEVEFLILRLDEAEKKMQIHEDGLNSNEQEKTSP